MPKSKLSVRVGVRVRQLRESRGLSRDDVALALGIGQPAVGRIERGERLPRDLEGIAYVLGCEPRDLFDFATRARRQPSAVDRLTGFAQAMAARDPSFPGRLLRIARVVAERPKPRR